MQKKQANHATAVPAMDAEPRSRAPTAGTRGSPPDGAAPVLFAGTCSQRVRGLLARRPTACTLVLMPCCDVHTFGMRYRLDIAFVDAAGCVVAAYRDVGPFRRLRHRESVAVLERFSSCSTPWFRPGDHVGMVGLRKGAGV